MLIVEGELRAYCGVHCPRVMIHKPGRFSCFGCGVELVDKMTRQMIVQDVMTVRGWRLFLEGLPEDDVLVIDSLSGNAYSVQSMPVGEYYELHQTPLRDLQDENARLRARLVDISKCSSGYYSDFSSHLQQLAEDALEIQ